jgi:Domain of unknown function (DUF4442)
MTSSTSTYDAWRRLSGRPGGTRLFSLAAMARVPYFASVLPHVVRMEPGLAEVRIPKWFMVYNHLSTVHAIASCNAAEVAMGMLMEATVTRSHRWIPKAYKDQARPGEGHLVAARAGPAGPAGFHSDHRRRRPRRAGYRDRPKRYRGSSRRHHHVGHTGRLGRYQISPVPATHKAAVELQHLVHQGAALVAVIDDQD